MFNFFIGLCEIIGRDLAQLAMQELCEKFPNEDKDTTLTFLYGAYDGTKYEEFMDYQISSCEYDGNYFSNTEEIK